MAKAERITSPGMLSEPAKSRFDALVQLNSRGLENWRDFLLLRKLLEVQASALTDLTGCDSRALSIGQIPYVPEQHNRILQLDSLATTFRRGYFTINETHRVDCSPSDDTPSTCMTLESVWPVTCGSSEAALGQVIASIEDGIKFLVRDLVEEYHPELFRLGSDLTYLTRVLRRPFVKITYDEACRLLNDDSDQSVVEGRPFSQSQIRQLLSYFCWIPIFVMYGDSDCYHSTVRRTQRGRAFASELILPKAGVAARGSILEGKLTGVNNPHQRIQTPATLSFVSPSVSAIEYYQQLGTREPGERAAVSLSFEHLMAFILGVTLM